MRPAMTALLALAMFAQKSCPLERLTAEGLRTVTEQKVRNYFPNARASAKSNLVLAYACVVGTGPGLINKLDESIRQDPEINQLIQMRQSIIPLAVDYIGIGLDSGTVLLNVRAGKTFVNRNPSPLYIAEYNRACGFVKAPTLAPEGQGFIYVAGWKITYLADGQRHLGGESHALGIYPSDEEFQRHEEEELQLREDAIRRSYLARGMTIEFLDRTGFWKMPLGRIMIVRTP